MKPIIRNILAVVAGIVAGSAVNMGLVMLGGAVIAAPAGADVTTTEGLKASMHLFTPVNFLFPFLAHAVGTFIGSLVAALISTNHKMVYALVVSVWFLAGGIINVVILPSPLWFTLADLILAYIPMGYLAGRLIVGKK
ncbi:MAG: hypothetical protein PHP04_12885 [Bacteroidales bacterium]|nr:hypothetical protein [Bacteroidales bacterium]HNW72368.1 hypothetical protein [Bacteroidales bacterium]HPS49627.1 hypothetical protein [Bacteroidales bacterium]